MSFKLIQMIDFSLFLVAFPALRSTLSDINKPTQRFSVCVVYFFMILL